MNRRATLTFVLLMVITGVSCRSKVEEKATQSPSPAPTALTHVRYGVSPFQDTLLPIIGKELGWYKEEGLDVEFKILGWTEVQEALAAGEVDVAINNTSSVVATHNRWPEFVYYYGFNVFDAGAALMGRKSFKSAEEFEAQGFPHEKAVRAALAQLKGKTVVTTGNTDMEQSVLGAAYRVGLDFKKDLKIVDLNPDEGLAAFLSGTGDFYLGGIPQRTRLTKEGFKAIAVGVDLAPPPINGIVTTRSYASKDEETLLKLLKVWFRIVNYVQEHTDDGGRIVLNVLNKQTGAGMTATDFRQFWQHYEHYPLNLTEIDRDILSPTGYAYWKKNWDDCNWYFHDVRKSIPTPVPPAGVFLMEDVQKKLRAVMKEERTGRKAA